MAYPTVSAPYGFRPINRVDGMPYAGATRTYAIDTAADIFFGDLVILVQGKIQPFTGTNAGYPLGVFMGCSYVNTMGQPIHAQWYPANTANATAKVVVDDQAAYQVVVLDAMNAVDDATTIASIGANIEVSQGAGGNTTTGDSGMGVLVGSESIVDTVPIRVVDVVPATKTVTGYPELIVKINVTQFQNPAGVV